MANAFFGFDPSANLSGGALSSQTKYFDPTQAQQTISGIGAAIPQAQQALMQGIQNPTASPLFTGQLQGLLSALRPQEQQQQQDLADVFRGAGNMSSGIYGGAASKLIGQQGLNRGQLTSQLMNQVTQQLIQSLLPQALQGPQLLDAMKLSETYRAPYGTSGGGGRSGGSVGIGGGIDELGALGISASNPNNPNSPWYTGGGVGGASTGVNATPAGISDALSGGGGGGLSYDLLSNPYFASQGATFFGPGGQFASSSGPNEVPWAPPEGQWESPYQNIDFSSGEY